MTQWYSHSGRAIRRIGMLLAGVVAGVGMCGNALAVGDVVISQVWGGTTSLIGNALHPKADYIELFNRTANPVSINGWSINVDTPTGTTWTKHDLPNVSIPAFSYYLIQVSATASAGIDLPGPDTTFLTPSFTELSSTIGKVALRNTTTAIGAVVCPPIDASLVDLVTYGTSGTCIEGLGRAPAGSATGSGLAVYRGAGGCTDTDNNVADFSSLVPAPRFSGTTSPGGCTSGACCNDNTAACSTVLGALNCPSGSTYSGDNSVCVPSPCAATGACCNDCTFACSITTVVGCGAGSSWSTGQVCTPVNYCTTVAPPGNDLACNAVGVSLNVSVTGQLGSATSTNDGPASTCQATPAKAVWYTFQPATSGYYAISTCGATFDDELTVLTGDCNNPSGMTIIDCDDDTCVGGVTDTVVCGTGASSTLAARIDFVFLTAPTTYYLRVQASSTTSVGGTFPVLVTTSTAGACCNNTSGACTTVANSAACSVSTSTYQGDGTACSPSPCPPSGACCNNTTGNCTTVVATACATSGGTYQGNGVACTGPNPCPPQANVSIVVTSPVPCGTTPGSALSTVYTIANSGPFDATNVTVTVAVPAPFGFTASTPSGSFGSGTLTVNLGTILVGFNTILQVDGTSSGGTESLRAAVTSDQLDPVSTNNAVTQAVVVIPAAPIAAQVLLSDIASSGTSFLPASGAFAGANIPPSAESFSRPFFSPNGQHYIVSVDTDLATTQDRVLIVGTTNPFTSQVVVQEGVTELTPGETFGEFDYGMGINDSGQYVFSATTSAAATTNDVIVRGLGIVLTIVAREGDAATAIGGGVTYSGANSAYAIRNNGQTSFFATLAGTGGTSNDTAVFDNDGALVIGQEGTTIPGSASESYKTSFPQIISGNVGEGMSVNGVVSYTLAGLLNSATTNDDIFVFNGNVVLRESDTLPGFSDPIAVIAYNNQSNNGDWLAYGTTTAGLAFDWVVRNGAVVTKTGQPVVTGSNRLWDDGIYSQTFFGYVANGVGDSVVAGTWIGSNGAVSTASNALLALNGQSILVRENDPIDVNGNGLVDDDAYIGTFRDDRMFLSNDGWLYFNARIRTGAAACTVGLADSNQAFLRIQIPQNGACCCGATCSLTSAAACVGTNKSFAGTGTVCTPFSFTAPCCRGDYNKSGSPTSVQDIFDFLTGYFSGDACADTNDTGGANTVQDIFDFLTAYFGGC